MSNDNEIRQELDLTDLDQSLQMKLLRFVEAVAEGNEAAIALVEQHERMIADGTN